MAKLALLPGWGLGPEPLQPLLQRLAQEHEVSVYPLPALPLAQALQQLDREIAPDSWLAGWSLGGMLATALAVTRGAGCPGLMTLASNPSFVTRADWPQAMPAAEFNLFQRRVQRNWATGMQGFWALCTQGDTAAWPAVPVTVAEQHLPSLDWLAELDNRAAIRTLQCRQLHVLAVADALVPASVAGPLARLNVRATVQTLAGSHAFVLSRADAVADSILGFIRQPADGDGHA